LEAFFNKWKIFMLAQVHLLRAIFSSCDLTFVSWAFFFAGNDSNDARLLAPTHLLRVELFFKHPFPPRVVTVCGRFVVAMHLCMKLKQEKLDLPDVSFLARITIVYVRRCPLIMSQKLKK